MGLEATTFINGLIITNPAGGDPKSQGDDHIRLLKSTILNTFPNITGAVTSNQTELNLLDGLTATKQFQFPLGFIALWNSTVGTIPSGWRLCDGGGGTPDLRDRFVRGGKSGTEGNRAGSDNAIVVSHSHSASSIVSDGGHNHNFPIGEGTGVPMPDQFPNDGNAQNDLAQTNNATTGISVSTTVNSAGSSGSGANRPLFHTLVYIQFIG